MIEEERIFEKVRGKLHQGEIAIKTNSVKIAGKFDKVIISRREYEPLNSIELVMTIFNGDNHITIADFHSYEIIEEGTTSGNVYSLYINLI